MASGSPLYDLKRQLESNAKGYGQIDCKICHGMGIFYDPFFGQTKRMGSYRLCKCVEEQTVCDGNPPYEYFDFEKNAVVACPTKPARLVLQQILELERNSGIPDRYRGRLIESVDISGDSSMNVLIALDHAAHAIQSFGSNQVKGLYLYGPTGAGKTLLSCVILNELIRLYRADAHYAKISRDIIGKLRDTFNPQSEAYGEGRRIEQELGKYPALVIDDFGVQRESPWVNSVLYDLIDTRYENNLLTILTSNEPMDSWKEIAGGRVLSRLREMCLEIHMEAPDFRLRESKSIR
ncbi:MAG: ATP-binding protein [Leptonema sp. (in: Bacteria)]|nr:ATP-binding protein [Leptonema sp. (in: bacteria)]